MGARSVEHSASWRPPKRPFVQVPSHINVRDGQITLINNDHTILGLRASAYLMPYLPEKYRLLTLLQSIW